MARFIHQRMPQTRVTVVEIDPGVVTAARRYFRFPEEDARLQIVIGDGAQAVPQRPASCDVLVVDGFVNGSPRRACARDRSTTAPSPRCARAASWSPTSCPTTSASKPIAGACGELRARPALLLAEEEDNFIAFALRSGPPASAGRS